MIKKVDTNRKYQLQVAARVMSIPPAFKASFVIFVSNGSVVPSSKFAEKPPLTPAKAAAIPASG